ncbi:hypothetical protein L914_05693, partial [Phytophthora nicotianae]
ALLFTNTLGFADTSMIIDEDVEEVLTATIILHYSEMLLLSARSIGKAAILAWSDTIRRAFASQPEISKSSAVDSYSGEVLSLVKRQSERNNVLILQNKRLEERLLSVEAKLQLPLESGSPSEHMYAHESQTEATQEPQQSQQTVRSKK